MINHLISKGWSFDNIDSKILLLTHKGIASKLDYPNLLDLYQKNITFGREKLIKKEDLFSDLLLNKVEKLHFLYKEKKYGDFISMLYKNGFRLTKHSQKEKIKKEMSELEKIMDQKNIGEVLEFVFEKELIAKFDKIISFEDNIKGDELEEKFEKNKIFYESLLKIPYKEVTNLFKYVEDQTPFSTKHGVKGAEYNNVLVVVDDKSWNQYNFNTVLSGDNSNQGRHQRSLNLMYVCCSRAIDNLAVCFLSSINNFSLETARDWFRDGNVHDIGAL